MEQVIDDLEQQNMEMRAEMGQMREQINKMFELLKQNTALPTTATTPIPGAISNAATRGTPTYPSGFTPEYGMPLGWNTTTVGQVVEGQEQAGASHPAPQPTQATTGPTLRAQDATPLGDEKINSLEERVRLIEGTGGHGLDATDLCLMSDVALPTDFKTPKFEKYKGSSCPRVHLAMYCRKMAAYIH
ncbi:hypothetical protein CR513_30706, partial [Mucuna pruriens]